MDMAAFSGAAKMAASLGLLEHHGSFIMESRQRGKKSVTNATILNARIHYISFLER